MVAGGHFDVLIEKDTTIPTSAQKTFTTVRDGQTQVRIVVMQGVSKKAEENELLGEFLLDGLRDAPAGEIKIEVNFEISADGIVGVSAKNIETGHEQAITVTASSGLTEDEIHEMAMETQASVPAPVDTPELTGARKEVEALLEAVERILPKARDVICGTDFGADAVVKADHVIRQGHIAIEQRDIEALKEALPPLERTLSFLSNVIKKLTQ